MSFFTAVNQVKESGFSLTKEHLSLFKFRLLFLIFCFTFLISSAKIWSQPIYLNEAFNTNPILSNTDVDAAWYPDRYRPAAFESFDLSGENVLRLQIDGAADGAASRPPGQTGTFYNTQGRKFNQGGLQSKLVTARLYIPADWATKKRRSDIWASAQNISNVVSYYPILGFGNTLGNNPTFRYWNGLALVNATYTIVYDTWYDLEMELDGNNLIYRINGDVIATLDANGSVSWKDIIVQAYNFNDSTLGASYDPSPDNTYDAYWDDIISTGPIYNESTETYHSGIQAAIDASNAGDKIAIPSGTYTENINTAGNEVILAPGASPGCVEIVGTMTLDSNDELEAELDGLTVCTHYDQWDVSGTVTLGGASLDLILGFAPSLGDDFEIIISDVPISGQFAQGQAISATYMSVEYVFSIDYSGNKVTLTVCSGGVTNTTTNKEFCSIQAAINDAGTLNTHTIEVASGTYDEQVLVNKSVSITGVGATKPILLLSGVVSGVPALINVTAPSVAIDNLQLNVDLTKLSSGIIASATNISGITIKNNLINATGSSGAGSFGAYGNRNAVSINYSGAINYRVAAGGVNNILFENNTVTAGVDAFAVNRIFRAGVCTDEAGGTFTGNTIQSVNQDIQVRFGGNGNINITNNNLNGGGVDISDSNAGAGDITISGNTFNSALSNVAVTPRTAVLRLKNNQQNKVTTVSGNTFIDALWSVSSENYRNVTIDNNIFSAPASSTDYLHIGINTKSISSNSNLIVQSEVNGIITNNVFNGSGSLGGTAIGFFNHDSDNASFGNFTIGTSGNENDFGDLIGQYIRLDNQTGITDPATIPTNYPDGGSSVTTMACWNQDYDIRNNLFNVGAGLQATNAMSAAQITTLENRLFHNPDASCTGTLTFFDPVTNVTQTLTYQTIAAAINAANPGDVIELKEWTFNEKVIIDKSLTLQGVDKFNVILDGTGLGNARGIEILNGVTNVTVQNLTVQNYSGNSPNSFAGIYAVGGNNGLTIQNVNVFDNLGGSGIYANGPVDDVTINLATVSGHTNVAGAARGIVIWNGHKSNITITNCEISDNNCCGIELQDGTASGVNISNNTLEDNGDNGIGIVGMTYGNGINIIENNTITNCGRFGIEIKNPDGSGLETGDGAILVQGNTVARDIPIVDLRDIAAIAVMRRGVLAGNVDVPSGVVLKNNNIFGYLQPSASEGFGIVVEGSNHTITNNIIQRCNVGFQIQAGNGGYPGDSDQSNLADQYFGRANSPVTCQVIDAGQTYGMGGFFGNGENFRLVGFTDFANENARGVLNTTTAREYCTIQRAIDNTLTLNTHTLQIKDAAYHENVILNKQLSLAGVGTNKPRLSSPGPNNFIMRVEQPNVTVQNLHFLINQGSTLRGIITTASGTYNNLSILNNYFEGTGTTGSTVFGSFAMELGSFGGVNSDQITVTNNEVEHTGTSSFGRALRFWNAHGSVGTNQFTAWYTVQGGDPAGGDMSFTGNTLNGVLEFNNGQTNRSYDISGNTFGVSNAYGQGSDFAHIEIKNNSQPNALVNIENNTFSGHSNFSIFSGRSGGVSVQNNTFTPDAGAIAFTHVHSNTKHRTSSFPSLAFSSSITLLGNTFNGNAAPGQNGKAIELANHDNVCNFGAVVFGTNAQKNIFQSNLAQFIRLNAETGTTTGHPIWGSLQASTMAKVSQDFDITENTFDVGAGQQMPSAMNFSQLNALESKLYHKPDDNQLGQLLYYLPVTNLTTNVKYLTIQSAIDAATAGDIIDCDEWIFNERVNINKTITLQGSGNNTIIEGTGTPGSGHAVGIPNGVQNVTIKDLRIQNFSGVGGIAALQNNSGLEVNNVTLNNITPGGVALGAIYVNGIGGINNIDILNNTITNTGAGRAIVIWNGFKQNINISGNVLTNNTGCCGIELQDGTASGVTISNNQITNMGDNGIGVVGLKGGAGANVISGNTILNCGRFGIEVKLPYGTGLDTGDGSIVVQNNNISQNASFAGLRPSEVRDLGGIVVIRRGLVVSENNEDIPQGVIVRNNTVSGFIQNNGLSQSEGFGIVVEGISHQVLNNTLSSNDVDVQVQSGHTPYAANTNADGDQSNLNDQYFGRGNSPVSCDITATGNSGTLRLIGIVANDLEKLVTNVDADRRFCSINAAIASSFTENSDVITASAATYPESVNVSKSLDIRGAKYGMAVSGRTFMGGGETIVDSPSGQQAFTTPPGGANNVSIRGFSITSSGGTGGGINMSGVVNNLIVRENILAGFTNMLAFSPAAGSSNVTFAENEVFNAYAGAYFPNGATGTIAENHIHDLADGPLDKGAAVVLEGSSPNVTVSNNFLVNNNKGVYIHDQAAAGGVDNLTGTSVSNNDLSGNDNAIVNNRSVILEATCNWYGSDFYADVNDLVTGKVIFTNYLLNADINNPDCGGGHTSAEILNLDYTAASQDIFVRMDIQDGDMVLNPIPGLDPNDLNDLLVITGLYQNLGIAIQSNDPEDIQAAALAIGDDVITEYYYFDNNNKTYLQTAGGNPLVKNKYWQEYLVKSDDVRYPNWLIDSTNVLVDEYRTSTNPATMAVNSGWLNDVLGRQLYVTVTTIQNGYVSQATDSVFIGAGPVVNTRTGYGYPTIQSAVNSVNTINGDTISVAAGTYAENVTVHKELTILGPNAAISPNDGIRVAEAIIVPATSNPGAGNIMTITASDVKIIGFTIDGNNPLIGVAKDALRGVFADTNGLTNVDVSKNIIRNLEGSGVRFQQFTNFFATTIGAVYSYNNLIDDNRIENITSLGIDLRQSMYTKITNNTVSNARYGIYLNSFRINDLGLDADRVISGNTLNVTHIGIWANLFSARTYNVSNNIISVVADPLRTKWYGIMMSTVSGAQNFTNQLHLPHLAVPDNWTFSNNNIDGAGVSVGTETFGYWIWSVDNFRDVATVDHFTSISGGSLSNVDYALYMSNVDSQPETNYGIARTGAHVDISNISISLNAGGTGIYLKDNPTWTTAVITPLVPKRDVDLLLGTGVTINGGAKGFIIEHPFAEILGASLGNIAFNSQTTSYVELNNNAVNLNGITAAFDGQTGGSATLSQNYDIEDKIIHATDNAALGFVRVKSNEVFVTPLSGLIQRGVNVATSGDQVNVKEGTYAETVLLNKSLNLQGANSGISPNTGSRVSESIITGGITIDGGQSKNLEIEGFMFDAVTSPLLYNGGTPSNIDLEAIFHNNIVQNSSGQLAIFETIATNSVDLAILDNRFLNMSTNTAQVAANGGQIELNFSQNYINGTINSGLNADGITNSSISANTILNTQQQGIQVAGTAGNVVIENNEISNANLSDAVDRGGIRLYGSTFSGPVTVNNNKISASNNAIAIRNGEDITGKDITVENNSLLVNPGKFAIYHGGTGPLDASCNWYGTTNYVAIDALTSGNIVDIPYLTDGTDASMNIGFQPVAMACGGTPVVIASATPDHIICGEPSGSIEVVFSGGTGPYTISWTGGGPVNATSPHTISGLAAGMYTITVTDALLTTSTMSATILSLPVTNVTNTTYHATIQDAVNAATAGNTISVCAGTFNEDVVINKTLILNGAGIGLTNVVGPIGGEAATIRVSALNVQVTGFSITRAGNNVSDWNNANLNSPGVAVQGQASSMILRESRIWGNRSGIDINNSNNNQILNCIIEDNHTGLIFRNQTDNTVMDENFIQNNRTVGVLFLDASGGTNVPVQTAANSSFNNNSITGNWYAQVVDRQTGGSLPAPGANLKNFECNWYGVDPPVVSNANSAEPGYASLLPIMFGGSATAPGGQPDIAGLASANIKFQPYLTDGADNMPGIIGFQPVPGNCQGCLSGGVINTNTSEFYCSIQEAINDVTTINGHILQVLAGTYVENIQVTKSLTILGPNAAISPNGGTRVAEAILLPATSDIDGLEMIQVLASNVTISGLTIDGNNPALTSGFLSVTGVDIDAAEAITVYTDNRNNLNVSKNIIRNLSYFGVTLYGASFSAPATTGHVIDDNLFQDFGTYDGGSGIASWGGAVLLYNNQYAQVSNNTGTNLRIGVQTGNYAQANTGAAIYQSIENNTFSTRRLGIFHNLHYSAASPFTFNANNFTAIDHANEVNWDGISLASLSVPCTTTNNIINAVGTTKNSKGIQVWNVNVSSPAVISGGTISNVNTGVFLNNFEGYNSDATFGAHASISGLSISPNAAGTGIRLLDSPSSTHANVQLTIGAGVSVTGGTKGLTVENDAATLIDANNIVFSGTTGNYIELIANDGNIDATAATFDTETGASATLSENYDIEDKILHGTDAAGLGFVRVKTNEVFVTPLSASIQRGVNAAASGDQVNVKEGTYAELVSVLGKTVHLKGANRGTDGNDPRISESKIVPPASSFGDVLLTIATGAHGTTVDGFEMNGNNPSVTSGLVVDGEDIDASYGVYVEECNNIIIENSIVKNLGENSATPAAVGIFLHSVTPTSGSVIRRNLIQNIEQPAMSATLNGIISHWNAYSEVYDNTIRKVRTGIQTGNAHLANPGAAARIENNDIESTRIGIWHNLTYNLASAYTIQGNKIKAVVGNSTIPHLLNYDGIRLQSFSSNNTPAFITENEVDGNVTAIQTAKPAMEVQGFWMENLPTAGGIAITNNHVKNVSRGVYAAPDAGNYTINNTLFENVRTGLRILGGSPIFSGNSFQGVIADSLVNHSGSGNVTLNCNWWGTTILEDIEERIYNTGAGSYTLNQLLTNGTDQNLVQRGFQPDLGSCIDACPDPLLMASTMDICQGEEITFTGSGAGVDEYLFYQDVNLSGSYDGGDVVLQVRSTDDTFASTTITHGQVIGIVGYKNITECPVNSATISITVRTRPVHLDSLHVSVCSEDEKTFVWNDHLTNAIASTYTWTAVYPMGLTGGAANGSGPGLTTTLINVTPGPLSAVYTVTPTGTNLCSGTPFTVTLPVNPEPITFNDTLAHCSGSPLNLDLTSFVQNNVDITAWNWTLTTSSIFVEGLPLTGTADSIYSSFVENLSLSPRTVRYTVTPDVSMAGCFADEFIITLIINPIPQAVANPNGPLTICDNAARVLNGNAFGGLAPYNYQWSIVGSTGGVGGAISVPSAQSPTLTTSGTGPGTLTIRLVVTDSRGCTSTDEIVFQVGSSPVLNTITGDNTVCAESTEMYQVINNPGSSYLWNVLSGGVVVSANNSFAADVQWVAAGGPFVVQLTETNEFGCSKVNTLSVAVNPLPTATSMSPIPMGTVGNPANITINGLADGNYTIHYVLGSDLPTTAVASSSLGVATFQTRNLVASDEGATVTVNLIVYNNATACSRAYNFNRTISFMLEVVEVQIEVMLSGPYNNSTHQMGNLLNTLGYLPLSQPYNTAPFNYGGSETLVSIPGTMVDWVIVRLRNKLDPTQIEGIKAGILHQNGTVTDVDGVSPLEFLLISDDYYIEVNHRNHLGAMSAAAVPLSMGMLTFDFTTGSTYGSHAQRQFASNKALWTGDGSGDKAIRYTASGNDRAVVNFTVLTDPSNVGLSLGHLTLGYYNADYNMNGEVRYSGTGNDLAIVNQNILFNPLNSPPSLIFIVLQQIP
jgi:parallel beta-helix repeat protein